MLALSTDRLATAAERGVAAAAALASRRRSSSSPSTRSRPKRWCARCSATSPTCGCARAASTRSRTATRARRWSWRSTWSTAASRATRRAAGRCRATLDEADLPNTLAIRSPRACPGCRPTRASCARCWPRRRRPARRWRTTPRMTDHGDHVRVYRALDELVAARVLVADAERYRFSQRGFISGAARVVRAERRDALHARLADCLAVRTRRRGCGSRTTCSTAGAIARRSSCCAASTCDAQHAAAAAARARAGARASASRMPRANDARAAQRGAAPRRRYVLAVESFQRQLATRCSISSSATAACALYRELSAATAGRAADARAHAHPGALRGDARARARVPDHRRDPRAREGLGQLRARSRCRLVDLEFLESLPSIEPLLPLSPSLRVVSQIIEGARAALRGQARIATQIYEGVLVRIGEPDRAGFERRTTAASASGCTTCSA